MLNLDPAKTQAVADQTKQAFASLDGALVVASSKTIEDDENDPPCIRAKREYLDILDPVKGEFKCVADSPGDDPLVLEVTSAGPRVKRAAFAVSVAGTGIGSQPLAHG